MKTTVIMGLLVAGLSSPADAGAEPKKLAFLVGINDYEVVTDLRGCVNDVARMESVLIGKFGFDKRDIVTLTDGEATRAEILARFRSHLIDQATADTIAVFHYSGHGSRMTDQSGDEREDGWDETIVPHDSRQAGVVDITDDELNVLMTDLMAKTKNVTAILDSCHSGSATRGGALARRAPDLVLAPVATPARRATGEGATEMRPDGASYVLISGSAPQELSNEFFMNGKPYGALSYYLTETLQSLSGETTYREIFDLTAPHVTNAFPSQHPQIEGARGDTVLFGDRSIPSAAHYRISRPGNRIVVDGGAVHGLTSGSLLDVYAPTVRVFQEPNRPIASIELTTVGDFTSEGTLKSGAAAPPVGARAVLRAASLSPVKLRVHYCKWAGDDPHRCIGTTAALDAVRVRAAETGLVEPVASDSEAQMIVEERAGRIRFLFADLEEASGALDSTDAAVATSAAARLKAWAKWFGVMALSNPSSQLSVALSVTRGGAPVTSVMDKQEVDVAIKNTSSIPLYITLLDVSTDGSINVLVSPVGSAAWDPGRSRDWGIELTVPPGRASVTANFKVLATTAPINSAVFQQDSPKSVPSNDPIAAAFENSMEGARTSTVVARNEWVTVSTPIRIGKARAAPAGVDAFAVHLPEGTKTLAPAGRSVLGDCAANPTDCWEPEPLEIPGTVLLRPRGAGRGDAGVPSMGAAWEEAYRLRKETNALRVEPLTEADTRAWNAEEEPTTRGGRERPDKAAAAADATWSLKHIAVERAWNLLRDKGAADGEEAKGIIVGHPDTGYRPHPEMWSADAAARPVLDADGYDFVDGDNDAKDELEKKGAIPNPGHGTKSGSVIVSPKGRQMADGPAEEYVSGVAPGARLVPLRVHRSVVHFKTGNLARAIANAAGDDRTLVKKRADVISISMGGLPGWSLWKAVKLARDKGVIVVAAAGNEVKTVVWPARFKEVVAVSASNVECGVWEGASRGGAVDVTAPGESVWRAATDPGEVDSIGMGQGTTFATATVAGVAALWLAYHRDAPEMAILKRDGLVTAAFLDALNQGVWRPDQAGTIPAGITCASNAPWKTGEYGAGIVNAENVLKARLSLGSRAGEARTIEDLPLFASLFPDGTSTETVKARYAALFGRGTGDVAQVAELEAEVVNAYANDVQVAAALDRFVADGTPASAATARAALAATDISPTLRAALLATPAG